MATILSFVKQQQQPGAPQMIKKRRSSGQSEASAATQSKKRPRCQATTSPNRQHQPQPVIDLCGSSEDESGSADLSSSRKTGHVDRKGSSTPAPKERKPQPIELDGSDDSEEEKASAPSQQVCPMCAKKLGKMASSKATEHVNKCLDKHPCPSSTSKAASSAAACSKSSTPQPPPANPGPTAFTALMASNAEQKQWKAAEDAAKSRKMSSQIAARQRAKLTGRQDKMKLKPDRSAPFYKILEGMPIAVDAFCYGAIPHVKAYFLSHAHSDHYTQLNGAWTHGPIYCSRTTANLIILKLGVDKKWVKPLDFDQLVQLPHVPGPVTVTMMDANHCPGSSIFLFEGPQTLPNAAFKNSNRVFRYLHCGDFRASPAHLEHPAMQRKRMDIIYLDTTYCDPKYQFPAQEQVISACAELIRGFVREGDQDALKRGFKDGAQTLKSEKMIKSWLGAAEPKREPKEEEEEHKPGQPKKEESNEVTASDRSHQSQPEAGRDDEDDGAAYQRECSLFRDDESAHDPGDEGDQDDDLDPQDDPMVDDFDVPEEASKNVKPEELKPVALAPAETEDDKSSVVSKERILVLVGTYSVGKERLVKAIAKALGTKVFGSENKLELIRCIDEDPELRGMLTKNPLEAAVHVARLDAINRDSMTEYLDSFKGHFSKIIGLRPTGWSYRSDSGGNKIPAVAQVIANQTHKNYSPAWLYPQRDSTDRVQGYGVPYSEHSSFRELTCFCTSVDHVRIIPTVNVHTESSRSKMRAWFERWQAERKRRRDVGEPQMVPYRSIDYW